MVPSQDAARLEKCLFGHWCLRLVAALLSPASRAGLDATTFSALMIGLEWAFHKAVIPGGCFHRGVEAVRCKRLPAAGVFHFGRKP